MIYCGTRIKIKTGVQILIPGLSPIDEHTEAFIWVRDVSIDNKVLSIECMINPLKKVSLDVDSQSFDEHFDLSPEGVEMCFADWTNPIILKHSEDSISIQLSYKHIPSVDLTICDVSAINTTKLVDGNHFETLFDAVELLLEDEGIEIDHNQTLTALSEYMVTSIFHRGGSFVDFYKHFYLKNESGAEINKLK